MADISIAILGLGRIGASVALALRRYNNSKATHNFKIAGFDSRPSVEKKATALKLADEMVGKAFNAVKGKDIVVIALPYAEVRAAYELISPDLRPGVVVMDMSPLTQPSLQWGKKYLSDGVHQMSITPIINPAYLFEGIDDIDHAHEDLFDKGSMLLMPSPTCIKDAVELAVDFSTLLGATPHFVDPAEHDGLIAATEGLPALLGLAAYYTFTKSQGWGDGQRMINPAFGTLTHHLFDTHPDDLRDLLATNRENMVRYLDELLNTLRDLRSVFASDDQIALEAALVEASESYEKWYNRRLKSRWDEGDKSSEAPIAAGSMLRGIMGGALADRLTGKKDRDN
jgi:prephenate dehydrogenase